MSNKVLTDNFIESFFYKYGLFASRHSVSMIIFSAVLILTCCYPLLNLPIPGSEPKEFFTLLDDYQSSDHNSVKAPTTDTIIQESPHWYMHGNQTAYIQQFIVKVSLDSWPIADVKVKDAIKTSLSKVFPILKEIEKFSIGQSSSVSKDCFRVSDTVIKPKQTIKNIFPKNGCFLISPAAYWRNNYQLYIDDVDIRQTINQFESKAIKTPPYVKELLFGLASKQIVLHKPKTVSFAVTLVLKQYNSQLIKQLEHHLHGLYSVPHLKPYHQACAIDTQSNTNLVCSNISQIATHIFYKPQMSFRDLIPLLSTYFILGCYIYFSVKKINYVKSKIGMAFSAVVSVIASLMMSVGLCSLIGLTPTLNGGEIFPYLVCVIGLENILVITKSVVSTHTDLAVQERIALGLCRESYSITKNLVLELLLIGVGYSTSVPEIHEFCAFAFVGILSDFFINMLFFVTILSIDIRRLGLEEDPYRDETTSNEGDSVYPLHNSKLKKRNIIRRKLSKNKSEPVNSIETGGKEQSFLKVPKRLRLAFFFAHTRMFQRGLMFFVVIWFGFLLYSDPAGIIRDKSDIAPKSQARLNLQIVTTAEMDKNSNFNQDIIEWNTRDVISFYYLSFRHWPTLFAYYNLTLSEKFVTVLPSILVPVSLSQNDIVEIIDVNKSTKGNDQHAINTKKVSAESFNLHLPSDFYTGRYQMTGLDYYLTLVIGAVSGMFMVFLLNIMYHCVCSRNYANWRSHNNSKSYTETNSYSNYVSSGDSVPLLLSGHAQLVDCVHVEGVTVTSADISGEIRTWDTHSGECTSVISRRKSRFANYLQDSEVFSSNVSKTQMLFSDREVGNCVWSLSTTGQFIVVGCDNGQIEVWDSVSGKEQCKYDACKGGVVGLACEEQRIVAARITGALDFLIIDGSCFEQQAECRVSTGELVIDSLCLQLLHTVRSAHQQPISAFEMSMRRVLTGSCDHTIKLFNFQDAKCQFRMSGHSGPITVLYMDKQAPGGAVSGATDGAVKLWDLLSGICLHTLKEHKASITAAQCSMHHIVSTAQDNKMCIWARRTGMLLNVTKLDCDSSCVMSLLGPNWCVTAGKGSLMLWDIRNGELLCRVPLSYSSVIETSVAQVHVSSDFCVVCVLGHKLFVVRFPAVLEKN